MVVVHEKRFRSIKFIFRHERKYIKMDVNGLATLLYLKKVFSKYLKKNYTNKHLMFIAKNRILDQTVAISENMKQLNESDDSKEELMISVQIIDEMRNKNSYYL